MITYDRRRDIARFTRRRRIPFPILSDRGSKIIRAFGLLNKAYSPNSFAYGIAYPMIFVVDRRGVIQLRFSLNNYAIRSDIGVVLREIRANF